MDEYAGTYGDLIETLKSIAARDNVKICTSSRPLIAFERAFATSPQLVLQNLTYDDIRLYTGKKLSQNDRMIELEQQEPGLKDKLTSSIVEKASGVFLWVYLVVGSLLDGLGNYDVGADLKRRLDDLPAELEQLYWHMVDRVKPVWYLEEGFRLLRLVKASMGSPEVLTLRHLCLAEMPEDLVGRPGLLKEPSLKRQRDLCRDMAGRLKSRCLGLLEVSANEETSVMDHPVSFLHKSVFDFLETDAAQSRIRICQGQDRFQPELVLLRAHILDLKLIPTAGKDKFTEDDWFSWIRPRVCRCIKLAWFVEQATMLPNVKLIRTLEAVVDSLWIQVDEWEPETVHWISAARSFRKTIHPNRLEQEPRDEELLDKDPIGIPGNITSFNELCQKAGLDLYAKAVGLEPWKPVRRNLSCQSRDRRVSPSPSHLKAAEEIWSVEDVEFKDPLKRK